MSGFDTWRNGFPNARLVRSASGALEVALHSARGELVFDGHCHEQFVELFHRIGEDRDTRVMILTGSGDAFKDSIVPDGAGYGLALKGISAADVARSAATELSRDV